MLLVDDILFSPIKGINWIFRKIHELAEEELEGEGDRLRESLTELYMQLETGQITEEEFEAQEALLLDRLDMLDEDDNMIGGVDEDDDNNDIDDEDEDEDEDEELDDDENEEDEEEE
jgi:hypothetical protein